MASRISWFGFAVGALLGGICRVTVMARHFPAIVGEQYPVALLPAVVGIVVGGLAAATGRVLLGAVVGAGLSVLFYLVSLPLVGVAAFLGAATPPALWEVLAVGAIPGAIGGAVGQIARKRRGGAPVVGNS
jgi:tetrahydromethanopterin S-methyltransferase subunit E